MHALGQLEARGELFIPIATQVCTQHAMLACIHHLGPQPTICRTALAQRHLQLLLQGAAFQINICSPRQLSAGV